MSRVRVRFAPSPTGELHIGSVRTILYNFLFARQHQGAMVLRLEDTDQDRLVPSAIDSIYDGLRWLGITWDEGPREGGPHAPYVQSERLALYREHAWAMVESDAAYPCFCSKERLDQMRAAQQARREITRYDRLCRTIPRADARRRATGGESHTIRLKVQEEGTVGIRDLVHGEVSWELRTVEDAILLKSDGFPTYHLAVCVDDHLMEISHILRGEEWLPSVPKHLLIYRAFGWEAPAMAHLPVVVGPDRKKLSKRHGATAVKEFREQGFIPEALVNYLALVGWAPSGEDEVFTMEDLVERWRVEECEKAPGVWDRDRLLYFNGVHIRRLDAEELVRRMLPFLPEDASTDVVRAAVPLVQERLATLAEARPMLEFLFTDRLEYPAELLVPKKRGAAETKVALARAADVVARPDNASHDELEAALRKLGDEIGWNAKDLFGAMRVAVTGKQVTPPLIGSILLLGRERARGRLRDAADRLLEPAPA